ncbi:PAS domain S-box protein [Pseudomonas aeruginosa]
MQSVTDYAIYMLDHRGRITNWNLGAQRIKGYLPEEVIGRHFSCFYTPRRPRVLASRPRGSGRRRTRKGRFEKGSAGGCVDGSRFWANAVIDPIRDSDGRPIIFAKATGTSPTDRSRTRELETARQELFQS